MLYRLCGCLFSIVGKGWVSIGCADGSLWCGCLREGLYAELPQLLGTMEL